MDVNWNYNATTQRFNLDVGFMTPARLRQLAFAQLSDDQLTDELAWTEIAGMLFFELVSYVSARDIDWWNLGIYATAVALYVFARSKSWLSGVLAAIVCALYTAVMFACIGLDARWLLFASFLGTETRLFMQALAAIYDRQQRIANDMVGRVFSIEKILRFDLERKQAKERVKHDERLANVRFLYVPPTPDDVPPPPHDEPSTSSASDEAEDDDPEPPEQSVNKSGDSPVSIPRHDLYSIARDKGFHQ